MVTWFVVMNNVNYARWLPVHIKDMALLPEQHLDVLQQINNQGFVVDKIAQPFLTICLDHAHEQANTLVKGDGSAICLAEDPACVDRPRDPKNI